MHCHDFICIKVLDMSVLKMKQASKVFCGIVECPSEALRSTCDGLWSTNTSNLWKKMQMWKTRKYTIIWNSMGIPESAECLSHAPYNATKTLIQLQTGLEMWKNGHPGRVSASTGVCGFGAATADLYTDKFNQKKFLNVHLKNKYVPAMKKYGCKRILMDNDSSHHAKTCVTWMERNSIIFSSKPPPPCGNKRCFCKPPQGFWFPAYAPEVSPAELYNNYIQQELDNYAQRNGYPSTLKILKSRIHQIIRKTPKSYFSNLMTSMPQRIKKMYRVCGGKWAYKWLFIE